MFWSFSLPDLHLFLRITIFLIKQKNNLQSSADSHFSILIFLRPPTWDPFSSPGAPETVLYFFKGLALELPFWPGKTANFGG